MMAWIQGGIRNAWAPLGAAFARRSAAIDWSAWLTRQWSYLQANFDPVFLAAALVMMGWLAATVWRSGPVDAVCRDHGRSRGTPLLVFSAVTLATALVWLVVFRQGSFIHVYWQLWLSLPAAALVGAFVAVLRTRPRLLGVALVALLALLVQLRGSAASAYASIVRDQLGTSDEIEFLRSLRNDRFSRFVFIPLVQHPLNEWPDSPLFLYYTDRPVQVLGPASVPVAGEKALLLRLKDRQSVVARIEARSGVRLANEKCSDRLCAYDVLPQ
jgi:hypothetical protein